MTHRICVGRRKTAVARTYLTDGTGKITINGRELDKHFSVQMLVDEVRQPFTVTETNGRYDAKVRVNGGGIHGQSGAIKMSIARALVEISEEFRPKLRGANLLTRDSRMVERKKYGQKKARKRFQFSKR
jgi:small subunit ribosomal protein S9